MKKSSALCQATGVCAQIRCDCGNLTFEVGAAINPFNGNNFIRVLECTKCRHQMPIVHKSDAGIAPMIGGNREKQS